MSRILPLKRGASPFSYPWITRLLQSSGNLRAKGGHLRLDLEMAQYAGRGDSALTPACVVRCLAVAKFKARINPSPGLDPSSACVPDRPGVQTVTLNPDVCQGLTVSVCSAEIPDANSRARIRQDPGSSFGAKSHWTVI